jgi:ABC-2 type transport system ATP-binding protein
VPGVVVSRTEAGHTVVSLERDADDQPLLRAALATGPVHGFSRRRVSLTELFRDAVGDPASHPDAGERRRPEEAA